MIDQDLYANAGAPMGRRFTQRISSSLLGTGDPFVRMPRLLQVGIWFGVEGQARQTIERLLGELGCRSAEELRDVIELPVSRLLARPAPESFVPRDVRHETPSTILRHALILGLSTASLFDPARPIIWTEASLTRRLELYDPQGFYA